jgi:hypothetical protein
MNASKALYHAFAASPDPVHAAIRRTDQERLCEFGWIHARAVAEGIQI